VSRLEAVITVTNILIAQNKVALIRPEAADPLFRYLLGAGELRGPVRLYVATAIQNHILLPTPENSLALDRPFARADLAAWCLYVDTSARSGRRPFAEAGSVARNMERAATSAWQPSRSFLPARWRGSKSVSARG
jgi:hypothetical protein